MLLKLEEKHRKQLLDFLSEEPEINLFIIGDIENYGFNNEMQDVWASFDTEENIEAVLLRYRVNFIPYFKNLDFDFKAFIEIINTYEGKRFISAKKSIADLFEKKLEIKKKKEMYFCALNTDVKLETEFSFEIKKAEKSDCKNIASFLDNIPEFISEYDRETALKNKIENNAGRIFFTTNQQGEIISTAITDAENKYSAMVMGVATDTAYRNQGRTSQCVSILCRELLDEGKSLCLFYDNPKAGRIYKRLGFEDIEKWTMLFL